MNKLYVISLNCSIDCLLHRVLELIACLLFCGPGLSSDETFFIAVGLDNGSSVVFEISSY